MSKRILKVGDIVQVMTVKDKPVGVVHSINGAYHYVLLLVNTPNEHMCETFVHELTYWGEYTPEFKLT